MILPPYELLDLFLLRKVATRFVQAGQNDGP
jgi:hypothetical protein